MPLTDKQGWGANRGGFAWNGTTADRKAVASNGSSRNN